MDGTVLIYLNSGTDDQPVFTVPFPLQVDGKTFDAGTRSAPRVYDWNRDGLKDLLVGELEGFVYYLKNEGTQKEPVFRKAEKLYLRNGDALRYPDPKGTPRSRVFVADWNNDGLDDILLGGKDGKVMLFLSDKEPSRSPIVFVKRLLLQSRDRIITMKERAKEKLRAFKR